MKAQQLAEQLHAAFERRKRDNGEEFTCLKDGSPAWMTDVIHAAHGDMLPDDFRYSMIAEVCGRLVDVEEENWEDSTHEIADGLVDVYNAARLRWLASHLERAFYCDSAQEDGLVAEDADMFTRIGIGQYMEYQEIAGSLIHSLSNAAEEWIAGEETQS